MPRRENYLLMFLKQSFFLAWPRASVSGRCLVITGRFQQPHEPFVIGEASPDGSWGWGWRRRKREIVLEARQ